MSLPILSQAGYYEKRSLLQFRMFFSKNGTIEDYEKNVKFDTGHGFCD